MATPSSFYCARCRSEYDAAPEGGRCCGQWLVPRYQPGPDKFGRTPDETVVVHETAGTQKSGNQQAHAWRVERYMELGFSEVDAELLALARDSVRILDRKGTPRTWTFPLNWQKVASALDAGCSHELGLSIFG